MNYAFPTAQSLAQAGVDAIFACGTGFRAKYIIDAAERVADGDIDLGTIHKSGSESRQLLRALARNSLLILYVDMMSGEYKVSYRGNQ